MDGPAHALFLGSGEFGVPILDALAAWPGVRLAGVVTTPARPAGRDARLRPTPVALRAVALGLEPLTPDRLRDPALATEDKHAEMSLRRIKVIAISTMWAAIAVSAVVLRERWAIALAVIALGVVGTWYILTRVPTKPDADLS